MPQHIPSTPQYNRTQKYFLLTNTIVTIFWLFLLLRLAILYPLLSSRFLASGIADFYLSILIATIILENFNYIVIFRHIPGIQSINNSIPKPYLKNLIITSISRLTLAFIIFNYPKVTRSESFPLIILIHSVKEFFRWFYNLQKVRLFNKIPNFNKLSRSITYLLLTPLEILTSIYIFFQSLIFTSYQINLIPYDYYIKSFLKFQILFYLPISYTIYKRLISKYFFAHNINDNSNKKLE
ncbi:hypothetical protein C6P40_004291 [Pichia californica]|uniref:Very-long-chain (3R)-3-hydroxyacyl-CoA dehydratase n=1 Tax=Pichia californica TaxID=460514 RepID=A0A9P7BGC9_9ASCO|nr:hypothetical protein C6P42_003791 [[Candida] californica]KAG0689881.1 hypothetical protein C6P40_004291 [[Candida] californica]